MIWSPIKSWRLQKRFRKLKEARVILPFTVCKLITRTRYPGRKFINFGVHLQASAIMIAVLHEVRYAGGLL